MGNIGFMEVLLIVIGLSVWVGLFAGVRAYVIAKRLEKQVSDLKSQMESHHPNL